MGKESVKLIANNKKARGKKLYDKRDDIAKKDAKREIEREFKARNS